MAQRPEGGILCRSLHMTKCICPGRQVLFWNTQACLQFAGCNTRIQLPCTAAAAPRSCGGSRAATVARTFITNHTFVLASGSTSCLMYLRFSTSRCGSEVGSCAQAPGPSAAPVP